MPPRLRLWLARLAAPAALLLAATVAVLLVRSALDTAEEQTRTTTTTAETAPARPAPPPPPRPAGTATTEAEAEFYTVQSGDTLATIADQYGTTVEELLLLNPEVDPIELSVGQRIRVQ